MSGNPEDAPPPDRRAILLITCPDAKGIVAAVTNFLSEHKGNILDLDQHVDEEEQVFFMRVEWDLAGFTLSSAALPAAFATVAECFGMRWDLRFSGAVPRMAVFVSRQLHCLFDILSRVQSGEWNVALPLLISNYPDVRPVAEKFGVPAHVLPVTPESRAEQERKQLDLLRQHRIDFIVLARYMQILSGGFLSEFPRRILNIHHSFLPAFAGSRPYHSAFQRGVKIIGATSHYVTEELDAGPIIAQDVIHVSHKDSVADLIRKGMDLEKVVLARAIWHHLQNQILVYNNKTVIFD